ncbi:hypothetical protein [Rhizobium sp. CECT 9324]|uniref:hypothetical protein n=1 Tax=Rhizobium sp. CECT 9324 TaxID=2845820 RepID=UPI001E42AE40|nr:hypothetical protein [Rhizobium sp. CECT 9324]CAH0343308.1 hypothetical protein RHI9324_05041 [Rhizobium sp. CECT 9324]
MTLQEVLLESYYSGNVYQGWIGAAIGAAGSIIGGLFGSKKKKEETITDQTTTSESSVDYQAMADKAAAAGFNPLTAIRNGGTGGFVTTQTRTQGKNVTTTSGGGASIGAGIADAGAQIAPLFGSMSAARADPIKVKNKTTGAISPLVSQQLRGSTLRAGSVVVAPRQTTRTSPVTRSNPATKTRLASYLEDGKLTNTDVGKQTSWWESDPGRVDGAQYEDAYGEFVGGVLGVIPALQDVWYNSKRAYGAADNYVDRKVQAANYRVMSRRPVVNNRSAPDGWHRFGN